jgi:hypothetical protein
VAPYANDHYGAFMVGTRVELVTALGLAVQAPPAGTIVNVWMHILPVTWSYGW